MSIYLLTAPSGAGKTTFCAAFAEKARATGWDVAGILSLARIEQGVKVGILAKNLRTGETRCLASLDRESPKDFAFGGWYFDVYTLEWGNAVVAGSTPCDLLIVDEIGPLELILQMGWQSAFEILARGEYRVALVVIRPVLEDLARQRLRVSEIIRINQPADVEEQVQSCWLKILKHGF